MSSTEAKGGETQRYTFRLSAEVLADLDLIAAHNGGLSRTDALRMAAKREADRIRREQKKG